MRARRIALKILYWLAVLIVSLAIVFALVLLFESLDDAGHRRGQRAACRSGRYFGSERRASRRRRSAWPRCRAGGRRTGRAAPALRLRVTQVASGPTICDLVDPVGEAPVGHVHDQLVAALELVDRPERRPVGRPVARRRRRCRPRRAAASWGSGRGPCAACPGRCPRRPRTSGRASASAACPTASPLSSRRRWSRASLASPSLGVAQARDRRDCPLVGRDLVVQAVQLVVQRGLLAARHERRDRLLPGQRQRRHRPAAARRCTSGLMRRNAGWGVESAVRQSQERVYGGPPRPPAGRCLASPRADNVAAAVLHR